MGKIVSITHDVEWPGRLKPLDPSLVREHQRPSVFIYPDSKQRISWAALREALSQLESGKTMILETAPEMVNSARRAAYQYAHKYGVSFSTDSWNNWEHGFLRIHRRQEL